MTSFRFYLIALRAANTFTRRYLNFQIILLFSLSLSFQKKFQLDIHVVVPFLFQIRDWLAVEEEMLRKQAVVVGDVGEIMEALDKQMVSGLSLFLIHDNKLIRYRILHGNHPMALWLNNFFFFFLFIPRCESRTTMLLLEDIEFPYRNFFKHFFLQLFSTTFLPYRHSTLSNARLTSGNTGY